MLPKTKKPGNIIRRIREAAANNGMTYGHFLVQNKTYTANGPFVKRLRYNFFEKRFEYEYITMSVGDTSAHSHWKPLDEHLIVVAMVNLNNQFTELTPIDVMYDNPPYFEFE